LIVFALLSFPPNISSNIQCTAAGPGFHLVVCGGGSWGLMAIFGYFVACGGT